MHIPVNVQNMNPQQKALWVSMSNSMYILDNKCHRKYDLDDMEYFAYAMQKLYDNRVILEQIQLHACHDYLINRLPKLANKFVYHIAVEVLKAPHQKRSVMKRGENYYENLCVITLNYVALIRDYLNDKLKKN